MGKLMMTDIATESFFSQLGTDIGGTAGQFVNNCATALEMHFQTHYDKLRAIQRFEDSSSMSYRERANYCALRYGLSIRKVYEALNKEYDPLANTNVVENEINRGKDEISRIGLDTTRLLSSNSEHSATTFDSPTARLTGKTEGNSTGTLEYSRDDEVTYGKNITKTKEGNIGVMPTQQLMGLEYSSRIKMTMFEFLSVVICMCFSSGIWECEDHDR